MNNNASSRAQTQTEIVMDTQTEIKELIKMAVASAYYMINFQNKLELLLDRNLREIENEEFRERAREALRNFANQEYLKFASMLNLGQMAGVVAFANIGLDKKTIQSTIKNSFNQLGKIEINKAYTTLGNSQAKVSNNMSLYGLSELQARYEERNEMLDSLRKRTNLVICDTHSDCSDRCFKWQGRIYSLDGTYGTTKDGRKYIPLEVAVNDTTFGRNNGLLGYNCRHKLLPYKDGMRAVRVSREEQQAQDELTKMQRALEREIRHTKDLAITFQGIDEKKEIFYKNKTQLLMKQYRDFCRKNNRVEYRSRLQI